MNYTVLLYKNFTFAPSFTYAKYAPLKIMSGGVQWKFPLKISRFAFALA